MPPGAPSRLSMPCSQDRTINPDLERFMAKRMGAKTIEIEASRPALISHPDAITNLILEALAGRALCDHGIVIDLSAMNRVSVDPELRTVRVEAGALLGDVDRETHAYGLAVPTGVVSKTGIAGLTLGGGVGWLVRKYGLTCDNVLSCEVVTAEGEIVTANAGTNADLFWGLRGGGGNFGIVTSFLYRAHPVSTVLGGIIAYARDQAAAMLRYHRDFMPTAPDELTAYAGLISMPDGTPAV